MSTAKTLPPVGSRFVGGEGKFSWKLEFVGANPAPEFEQADAHIVRVVETCSGGPTVGTEFAVETMWFSTHKAVRS